MLDQSYVFCWPDCQSKEMLKVHTTNHKSGKISTGVTNGQP